LNGNPDRKIQSGRAGIGHQLVDAVFSLFQNHLVDRHQLNDALFNFRSDSGLPPLNIICVNGKVNVTMSSLPEVAVRGYHKKDGSRYRKCNGFLGGSPPSLKLGGMSSIYIQKSTKNLGRGIRVANVSAIQIFHMSHRHCYYSFCDRGMLLVGAAKQRIAGELKTRNEPPNQTFFFSSFTSLLI
jgi:hypothetical protein